MHENLHWVLGIVDHKNKSVEVYNSLCNSNMSVVHEFHKNMTRFLDAYADHTKKIRPVMLDYTLRLNKTPGGHKGPKQTESECGIMVCTTAWFRVCRYNMSNLDLVDTLLYRYMIVHTITTGDCSRWKALDHKLGQLVR